MLKYSFQLQNNYESINAKKRFEEIVDDTIFKLLEYAKSKIILPKCIIVLPSARKSLNYKHNIVKTIHCLKDEVFFYVFFGIKTLKCVFYFLFVYLWFMNDFNYALILYHIFNV